MSESAPPPQGLPHVGPTHTARIAVPADGLCLYYCMIASEDPAQWVGTPGKQGMATTSEMVTKDLSMATELRESFIEHLEDIGDGLAAGRLAREGPDHR